MKCFGKCDILTDVSYGNIIHTVNIMLYQQENGHRRYLLMQDASNAWVLPGGATSVEDTNFPDAMERELRNNCGIGPDAYLLVGTHIREEFRYEDPGQGEWYGKDGILHLFCAKYNGTESIQLGKDMKDFRWVIPDEMLGMLTYPSAQRAFARALNFLALLAGE